MKMSAVTGDQTGIGTKKKNASASVFSRRDSVAVAGVELQEEAYEKLMELREIWDEVGMTEEQRRDRMATALNHVRALLNEMVEEEMCMRDTLRASLAGSKKEAELLLKQLNLPKTSFMLEDENKFTLLQMEEKYRVLKESLVKERDSRISEMNQLLADYEQYRVRLDLGQFDINKAVVPDKESLEKLGQAVVTAKSTWEHNLEKYEEKRDNILALARKVQVDLAMLTRFQRDILTGGNAQSGKSLVLSVENMDQLISLDALMQEKYNEHLEKLRQRIRVVQDELIKWWELCHVPVAEREAFQTVDPEVNIEAAIQGYNDAIAHWRSFYEARKTVLDKICEWERLWHEHVEFEERERDTNRYNNRGGTLLLEEKKRKKVQIMLAQVTKALSILVAEYDSAHPNEPFMTDGMRVMEYIQGIERQYQEKKKKEKEEKEQLKRQQLVTERLYGAAPSTPPSQRKRQLVTPSKPPTPKEKVLTSGQTKLYVHSSLAALHSPGSKLPPPPQTGSGSTAQKPPTGLPVRIPTQKRKVLAVAQHEVPVEQKNQQSTGPGNNGDGRSTISSGSYGEFATAVRSKGLDGQSTFITEHGEQDRPLKLVRLD